MRNAGFCRYVGPLVGLVLVLAPVAVHAQEQTTQQLPLPTGQIQQQSADKRWQLIVDSEFRNIQTKQTSGLTPATLWTRFGYAPIGMQFAAIPNDEWKIELGARSGYIRLHQVSNLGGDATYNGWTDTSLSGTVTYYGFNGFQPFVSMAVNLPTGRSQVTGAVAVLPADQDLTGIGGYGEGLNIGPTIGVNIPITKDFLATLSVGYTSRGSFTRTGGGAVAVPIPGFGPTENINPGDVTTATASLGYQAGPLSLQGSVAYSYEGITRIDGVGIYKSGQKIAVSGGIGYAWTEALSSKLSASFTHIDRDKFAQDVKNLMFDLLVEQFNTNSDVTTVSFDTTYKFQKFAVGPTASYLFRNHNGYDISLANFLAAKTKWSAGAVGQYAINDQFALNMRAEHIWMGIGDMAGTPQFDIRGWTLSFGGKATF